MKRYCSIVKIFVIQLFVLLWVISAPLNAEHNFGNTFAGKRYSVYLYNTEEGSTSISFEENMSLVIDVYDGFGLYLPIANLFTALYWSPNYKNEDDLLLIFNGMVVSDFIEGWGLVLHNYKFTGILLFFGYEE